MALLFSKRHKVTNCCFQVEVQVQIPLGCRYIGAAQQLTNLGNQHACLVTNLGIGAAQIVRGQSRPANFPAIPPHNLKQPNRTQTRPNHPCLIHRAQQSPPAAHHATPAIHPGHAGAAAPKSAPPALCPPCPGFALPMPGCETCRAPAAASRYRGPAPPPPPGAGRLPPEAPEPPCRAGPAHLRPGRPSASSPPSD